MRANRNPTHRFPPEHAGERPGPLWIGIISLFPELFASITSVGVLGRAIRDGLVHLEVENLRNHTTDLRRRVDDRPFGGGAGMVLQFLPLYLAKQALVRRAPSYPKTIYLSPQGRPLDQNAFRAQANRHEPLLFICGRYQGLDERFIQTEVDEEWSIGNYVLSGGEPAAWVCLDALSRAIPGTLGNPESTDQESFSNALLDHPHYTRPQCILGQSVPEVLISRKPSSGPALENEAAPRLHLA